jgi:deoxyribodipyrimidine photolyase-related protein
MLSRKHYLEIVKYVLVLGDQLNIDDGLLGQCDPTATTVLMIESVARGRALPYHKQKLALLYSAMRHFKLELEARGFVVVYESCDTFEDGFRSFFKRFAQVQLEVMQPAEYGVDQRLTNIVQSCGGQLEIHENTLWLSNQVDWARYANGKTSYRMEFFYRELRRRSGYLMDGPNPVGGRWNFDEDNRQIPKRGHVFPPKLAFEPDAMTTDTVVWVEQTFPDHFGDLDHFNWPVTRAQALEALEHFVQYRLELFGPFEDAVLDAEPQLYHSLLSAAMNLGLLSAKEVCERALKEQHRVPISSLEGFIRQILGWREFMRHVYNAKMPAFREQNVLEHTLALPGFYWTGETKMRCVSTAVKQLLSTGHTHHIQRLMVLGNFALIAGVSPQALNDWFWFGYVDAYDWVVTPNVIGMSQYADGGSFTSKPYASGGAYINRMSDHCQHCAFDPKQTTGSSACPFNSLYWHFIDRHFERFAKNQRMGVIVANWRRRALEDKQAVLERAEEVLRLLEKNEL